MESPIPDNCRNQLKKNHYNLIVLDEFSHLEPEMS